MLSTIQPPCSAQDFHLLTGDPDLALLPRLLILCLVPRPRLTPPSGGLACHSSHSSSAGSILWFLLQRQVEAGAGEGLLCGAPRQRKGLLQLVGSLILSIPLPLCQDLGLALEQARKQGRPDPVSALPRVIVLVGEAIMNRILPPMWKKLITSHIHRTN